MGELGAASKVVVMVSFWWSRGDALGNHQHGQILTRTGCVDVDIADTQWIDRALRSAVDDLAVLVELDQWWQVVETRRAGNSAGEPGPGPGQVDSVPHRPARRRHPHPGGGHRMPSPGRRKPQSTS